MNSALSNQVHAFIEQSAGELATAALRLVKGARRLRSAGGESSATADLDVAGTPADNTLYLPIKPAGYPIVPDTLDFGNGNPTTAQIQHASEFAQLVNQIPNAGHQSWTASGRTTWNIWDMLLDNAQLPEGASPAPINDLKAQFEVDKRLDMAGNVYFATGYSPKQFWAAADETQWQAKSLSPDTSGEPDTMELNTTDASQQTVEFDPADMTLSTDMILVSLIRTWWAPWIFDSQNWRFNPISLSSALSDGSNPPSGVMTMYVNAFLVARNVKINLDVERPKNRLLLEKITQAKDVSWAGFQIKGSNPAAKLGNCDACIGSTDSGIESTGMQILGFNCNVLPKSPDPDPNLPWPKGQ